MTRVSVSEAKTRFTELLRLVESGGILEREGSGLAVLRIEPDFEPPFFDTLVELDRLRPRSCTLRIMAK